MDKGNDGGHEFQAHHVAPANEAAESTPTQVEDDMVVVPAVNILQRMPSQPQSRDPSPSIHASAAPSSSQPFTPAQVPEIVGSRRSSLQAPPPAEPYVDVAPPRRKNTRSPSPRFTYDMPPEAGPSSRPLSPQVQTPREERFAPLTMSGSHPTSPAIASTPDEPIPRPVRALSYAESHTRSRNGERPDMARRISNVANMNSASMNGASMPRPLSKYPTMDDHSATTGYSRQGDSA